MGECVKGRSIMGDGIEGICVMGGDDRIGQCEKERGKMGRGRQRWEKYLS